MHFRLYNVNRVHRNIFIRADWGARLKQERLRIGASQEAVTHRNTQRSYEQERTAPDLNFLIEFESMGADIGFVLTGMRSADSVSAIEAELVSLCGMLSTDFVDALVALARSAANPAGRPIPPSDEGVGHRLLDKKIGYRAD